jgi:hypothetical protein
MTLARLLAAAFLICCVSALAQGQQSQSSPVADNALVSGLTDFKASTASEPWRIFPKSPADLGFGQSPLDRIRLGHDDRSQLEDVPDYRNFELIRPPLTILALDGPLEDEPTCYAIRSYVVARDSKDSDSTHRVSYSTCQPAARYQLKTTEMRSVTLYP